MDKADVILVLTLFTALSMVIGAIAGAVIAAFVVGILVEQRRRRPSS